MHVEAAGVPDVADQDILLTAAERYAVLRGFSPRFLAESICGPHQMGSSVKRLHRNGVIENIRAGSTSKWRLAYGKANRLAMVAQR